MDIGRLRGAHSSIIWQSSLSSFFQQLPRGAERTLDAITVAEYVYLLCRNASRIGMCSIVTTCLVVGETKHFENIAMTHLDLHYIRHKLLE